MLVTQKSYERNFCIDCTLMIIIVSLCRLSSRLLHRIERDFEFKFDYKSCFLFVKMVLFGLLFQKKCRYYSKPLYATSSWTNRLYLILLSTCFEKSKAVLIQFMCLCRISKKHYSVSLTCKMIAAVISRT